MHAMTANSGNIVLTNAVHWLRALSPEFSSPDMHLASPYKKESLNLGYISCSVTSQHFVLASFLKPVIGQIFSEIEAEGF